MKVSKIIFNHYLLRDIMLEDYLDMYEYGTDLEVVKMLSWGPFKTKKEALNVILSVFLERPYRGLPVGYAIIDLKHNKMIGTIDFHTKYEDNKAEIGYALNQKYWQQGIMSKALSHLLKIGFYQLGYDSIIIKHSKENLGSQKVIEKNGFKVKDVILNGFYNRFNETYEDVYYYEMTKKEYEYDNKS